MLFVRNFSVQLFLRHWTPTILGLKLDELRNKGELLTSTRFELYFFFNHHYELIIPIQINFFLFLINSVTSPSLIFDVFWTLNDHVRLELDERFFTFGIPNTIRIDFRLLRYFVYIPTCVSDCNNVRRGERVKFRWDNFEYLRDDYISLHTFLPSFLTSILFCLCITSIAPSKSNLQGDVSFRTLRRDTWLATGPRRPAALPSLYLPRRE